MSKKISLKQLLMKGGKFEKVYDCVSAIRSGKVSVSNKIITNPNYFFNPKLLVRFGGEKIKQVKKLYFLMNKPVGYLSQKSENEKTIYDLIKKTDIPKESQQSLFAVGRLDKDTEGLIIITNDGKLSSLIMNPESKVTKRYHAVLKNFVDLNKINILEKGIEIETENERYKTKPCEIKITGEREVYISVSEGKKRQIRLMFDAIGNTVVGLIRVSIGGLQLGSLKSGETAQISREELLEKLFQ
ncbi:rRNA pseudouridine synthase [Candidatus Woesearchaeota archaeon]|nr:rRNA pseudouridine synthase [Candidatus Woesearchaeota archaeon]